MKETPKERRLATPETILALLLLLLLAGLSVASPEFRRPSIYLGMTRFFIEVGLIALPMTLVIITGGMDLPYRGPGRGHPGIAWRDWHLAYGWRRRSECRRSCGGPSTAPSLWLPHPLIVTLATMAAYRGLAIGISRGDSIGGFPNEFRALGRGFYYLPHGIEVPGQLIYLIVFALLFRLFLARTGTGRQVYAIGLNETGAQYAGVPVGRVKLLIYSSAAPWRGSRALFSPRGCPPPPRIWGCCSSWTRSPHASSAASDLRRPAPSSAPCSDCASWGA